MSYKVMVTLDYCGPTSTHDERNEEEFVREYPIIPRVGDNIVIPEFIPDDVGFENLGYSTGRVLAVLIHESTKDGCLTDWVAEISVERLWEPNP